MSSPWSHNAGRLELIGAADLNGDAYLDNPDGEAAFFANALSRLRVATSCQGTTHSACAQCVSLRA